LSLACISDLRREQGELNDVVSELTVIYQEHQWAVVQLEEYNEQVDQLQRRNDALEELLFRRVQTYLVTTVELNSNATSSALPSRSGYEGVRNDIRAVNMPVMSVSGLTGADFEYVWQLYRADHLKGTGEALARAEQDYNINALVLAAIIVHESKWGQSAIARDKNNLAGLGAYDGSAYRSAIRFNTTADSIYFLAELLSRHYVRPGGRHYNGPDLLGIGKAYASDPYWAVKVAGKMRQIILAAVDNPEVLLAYIQSERNHN
jgi:beta-N-acetylglucosaminidase